MISTAFSCTKRHFPPKLSNDSFQPQAFNFQTFQNLPIIDQLSTLIGPTVAYRNIHFEPTDFVSISITILENCGSQEAERLNSWCNFNYRILYKILWYVSLIRMPLLKHTSVGYPFDIKGFMWSGAYSR